ncbi:MAG: DUF1801 domain-containing protein [Polyangiaceae bacterium]
MFERGAGVVTSTAIMSDIDDYNRAQAPEAKKICRALAEGIDRGLPKAEKKVWHGGPVWFLDGNPIVGYWARKGNVQLLFWSGQSFDEAELEPEGKFKAAQVRYETVAEIKVTRLAAWLRKAKKIQWDYKNIVKRRGVLEKSAPGNFFSFARLHRAKSATGRSMATCRLRLRRCAELVERSSRRASLRPRRRLKQARQRLRPMAEMSSKTRVA